MEEKNYGNGGTVITWKIRNFHCLESDVRLYSPYFYIGTTNQVKYRLSLLPSVTNHRYFFEGNEDNPSNICINYSSSIWLNDCKISGDNKGAIVSKETCSLGNFLEFIIDTFSKTVVLQCCLSITSDNNLTVNQYKLRTVVEAENRNFQFNLPIKTFDKHQKIFLQSPLACNLSIPLEIRISASENKGFLNIDIRTTLKGKNNLFLICKLSSADGKGKHLFTTVHFNEFKEIKTDFWGFPTPVNIKYIQSKDSLSKVLSLNFEFLVSENKYHTWVEEFCEAPIPQANIVSKSDEKNKSNLSDDYKHYFRELRWPDLEIIVGGKKLPAHKTVLCRSPVFSAMFASNMLEKAKNVVEISDLDPETVDKMLFFMYSEILKDQEWNGVAKLYAAADKYQIMTLKDKCASSLIEQLSPRNACEALLLADLHCDSDFLNAIQDFIVTHDDKILQSEEWKEFMFANSDIACQTVHKAWLYRSKKLKEDSMTFFT